MKTVLLKDDRIGVLSTDLRNTVTRWENVAHYHAIMADHCKNNHGCGMAANQAGILENFFFIAESVKMPGNIGGGLCINPSFTPVGDARPLGVEGCMSLPGRNFLQRRYAVIMAVWTNTRGHVIARKLKGWSARVFQHEYDHLCGLNLTMTATEECVENGRTLPAAAPTPAAEPEATAPETQAPQEEDRCNSAEPPADPGNPSRTE